MGRLPWLFPTLLLTPSLPGSVVLHEPVAFLACTTPPRQCHLDCLSVRIPPAPLTA